MKLTGNVVEGLGKHLLPIGLLEVALEHSLPWQQLIHQQQLHVDQVAFGVGVVFVVHVGVG